MLWNSVLLSFREIRRNIMRSFLTVLGVVIGVASVITMVTIGSGATAQIRQQLANMGTNMLMVSPGKRLGPGLSTGNIAFKEADAVTIAKELSSIAAVAPVSSQSIKAIYGNQNWTTQATGSDNQYLKETNRSISEGREFSESELRSGGAVCIVGQTVRKKLFGGQEVLGEKIRLQKLSCEVIGLLEGKGQNTMGEDQDDIVIVPLRMFQRRISGSLDVGIIQVSVQEGSSTEKAQRDIEALMRERRHLTSSDDDNFTVMDMKEMIKMLTGTTQLLTALLSAVAAVSLLVGGIGIMNIMLVSVTERTREIGVRLAIGALESDVLTQFLVEAVVLSSIGGLLGIVLATAASLVLAHVVQVPYIFKPGINILSFLFSAAIGVIFGFFPARRAASLDPINALRHE